MKKRHLGPGLYGSFFRSLQKAKTFIQSNECLSQNDELRVYLKLLGKIAALQPCLSKMDKEYDFLLAILISIKESILDSLIEEIALISQMDAYKESHQRFAIDLVNQIKYRLINGYNLKEDLKKVLKEEKAERRYIKKKLKRRKRLEKEKEILFIKKLWGNPCDSKVRVKPFYSIEDRILELINNQITFCLCETKSLQTKGLNPKGLKRINISLPIEDCAELVESAVEKTAYNPQIFVDYHFIKVVFN